MNLLKTPYTHWVWSAGITSPNLQWRTLSWSFHTMWGGIDPWDDRFGPRFVGIVDIDVEGF